MKRTKKREKYSKQTGRMKIKQQQSKEKCVESERNGRKKKNFFLSCSSYTNAIQIHFILNTFKVEFNLYIASSFLKCIDFYNTVSLSITKDNNKEKEGMIYDKHKI